MENKCIECGGPFRLVHRPDRSTCSNACRQRRYRRMKRARQPIPAALRDLPRWVRWVDVAGKKIPQQVTGWNASSTQPATWNTYRAVRAAGDVGTGVGFVLNGDGIVCVDLDHCLDEFGVANYETRRMLLQIPDTYIEVSPGGDGLHVWGYARARRGRRTSFHGQPVEMYGTGRYMTVTARPFANSPSRLANIQPLVDMIENM